MVKICIKPECERPTELVSNQPLKMKTSAITSLALFGLLCVVNAQLSTTTAPSSAGNGRGVEHTIWNQIKQLRNDYKQMSSSGQVNNQALISAVQALFTLIQVGIGGAPPQIRSQLAPQLSALQSQIGSMTSSGKFDPSIFDSLRSFARAVRNNSRPQSTTTVASGK